ncbi:MAG TPA: M23 family metallopeptidase [Gemmatimonadaceae bacterium]|nr:M23 family metallopeptidase [Gemmatimonadaceae bacterium]
MITIARKGDTALVVEDPGTDSVRAFPSEGVASSAPSPATPADTTLRIDSATVAATAESGASYPPVVPADIDALRKESLIIPVAGVAAKDLVDSFDDERSGKRHHNALDIMAKRNTPVLAAVSGTVLKLHNSVAGGLSVYMSDPTSRFVMMYAHLDSYKPGLAAGQTVKQGDLLGFVGSTGDASPLAPHLHFQITRNDNMKEWWKGTPINPFPIFRPRG